LGRRTVRDASSGEGKAQLVVTLTMERDAVADPESVDETPIVLKHGLTGADRAFHVLLATSGAIVLVVLISILAFLAYHSWWALKNSLRLHFFTGTVWSTPLHPGVLGILVGSVLIAVIAITVALPIALSIALMINEYVPPQLRGWLTGLVDLLAVVPSIVFGFWGLEALNTYVRAPVTWIAEHLGFIPIFRTTEPGNYSDSVFICGLIVAIMIIPVVASVSREVMAQAPRDAVEAAYGLGGTRWGSITDVILPFARNGVVGGTLLGISRALGETMAVVLVLSNNNQVTKAILGPGNGDIAKQIADTFPVSDIHGQSELALAGLTLFATTLVFSLGGRLVARRSVGQS
jgi:phosphate transport system permease protein